MIKTALVSAALFAAALIPAAASAAGAPEILSVVGAVAGDWRFSLGARIAPTDAIAGIVKVRK